MLLPFKNWLLNVLVSLVEFERVILIVVLLSFMSAGQEIIYPVGGPWVGAFSRWFYNNQSTMWIDINMHRTCIGNSLGINYLCLINYHSHIGGH